MEDLIKKYSNKDELCRASPVMTGFLAFMANNTAGNESAANKVITGILSWLRRGTWGGYGQVKLHQA